MAGLSVNDPLPALDTLLRAPISTWEVEANRAIIVKVRLETFRILDALFDDLLRYHRDVVVWGHRDD